MEEPPQPKRTVWIAGSVTSENLPADAVLLRTERHVSDARLFVGMRVSRKDATVSLLRPGDQVAAQTLGVSAPEKPEREASAAYGDTLIVWEAERPNVAVYLQVRRARFIALGHGGKKIACLDY